MPAIGELIAPLGRAFKGTNIGSRMMYSPSVHRINMFLQGLLGSKVDSRPSMLARMITRLDLSQEERRALTYMNNAGLKKALSAPPEIVDLAESATKKLERWGVGRPTIRQISPGIGAKEPIMLGARGRVTAENVRKLDPIDYVFRVNEKFTPKELEILETARMIAAGKDVHPPQHVINQFARRGVNINPRTGRATMVLPVNARSNPELMVAADPIYQKVKDLGLSDETIRGRMQFANVPEGANVIRSLSRTVLPLALTGGILARAVANQSQEDGGVPPIASSRLVDQVGSAGLLPPQPMRAEIARRIVADPRVAPAIPLPPSEYRMLLPDPEAPTLKALPMMDKGW